MRRFLLSYVVCTLVVGIGAAAAWADPAVKVGIVADPEVVVTIPWGTAPAHLGMSLEAPGVLPTGPYLGPGGFAVADDGTVWISDSLNLCLKGFAPGKPPVVVPLPAGRLGDVCCRGGQIGVISMAARALFVIEPKTPVTVREMKLPAMAGVGRLEAVGTKLWLLEEPGKGVWMLEASGAVRHPAPSVEPVGNDERIFGLLYDFNDQQRRLVSAGYLGQGAEPEMYALVNPPVPSRIAFARTLGLRGGHPVIGLVTASAPAHLQVATIDAQGNAVDRVILPVLTGVYLPAAWKLANGEFYGARADLQGFTVVRVR